MKTYENNGMRLLAVMSAVALFISLALSLLAVVTVSASAATTGVGPDIAAPGDMTSGIIGDVTLAPEITNIPDTDIDGATGGLDTAEVTMPTADDGGNWGVIGAVIAIVVVIAIILGIIFFMPKKLN